MVRRSTAWLGILGAAALALSCGSGGGARSAGGSALAVDESTPIGKKWVRAGGAAVLGEATTAVVTPAPGIEYQRFEHGTVVFSADFGAVLISNAICDRWLALTWEWDPQGRNLFSYVGPPTADFTSDGAAESAPFRRGTIVAEVAAGTARLVYGAIWLRYALVAPVLGRPVSEETAAAGGGRVQGFQNGDIYLKWNTSAQAVMGPIRERWLTGGGPAGALGYPSGEEKSLVGLLGEAGRSQPFEGGSVVSSAAGTFVLGRGLSNAYEGAYGGSSSWLGFPVSDQRTSPGGKPFADFQLGVVVMLPAGLGLPERPWAVRDLDFWVQRVEASGSDCGGFCFDQDLYVHMYLTRPDGSLIVHARFPGGGTYDGWGEPRASFDLTPGADSIGGDFAFHLHAEGRDRDMWPNPDDSLGTVTADFDIDNLWGTLDGQGLHQSGKFGITYAVRNPIPFKYDPIDAFDRFPSLMGWSFLNFGVDRLTYHQYSETFQDVSLQDNWITDPFNKLYYEFYKLWGSKGHCFGMSLESVMAEKGLSMYSEPIYRFPLETQMIHELGVKQGYQLGAQPLDWILGHILTGDSHDPKGAFRDSKAAQERGDTPIMYIFSDYFFADAHAVRPYHWDDTSGPDRWTIHVADPNYPGDGGRVIQIDTSANTYEYGKYSGGEWLGGRMFEMPFHVVRDVPHTPMWGVAQWVMENFTTVVTGGRTMQVTDGDGRTFFQPGLPGGPALVSDMQPDAVRIPDLARIPPSGGDVGAGVELWYARGAGATHRYEVVPGPGLADGAPYEFMMSSGTLSAHLVIPGTPGVADVIAERQINGPGKAVALTVPAAGRAKAVRWLVAGPQRRRWAQLDALALAPGQTIAIGLANGGYDLAFQNDGPATTAILTVASGPGAEPVAVGEIRIPGHRESTFNFDVPRTTLAAAGGQPGNAGWLTSPPTVTLTAEDYSSRGIDYTEWSVGGVGWRRYTGPFLYAEEGETVLQYRSRDRDGNQEPARSEPFKIDTRPPVVTASVDRASATRVTPVVVRFSAQDPAPGSGIAVVGATLDGTPVTDGQAVDLLWNALGTHTLTATATDVAGLSATASVTFEVVATLESLRESIRELHARGAITGLGVARSLVAKVEAAMAARDRGQPAVARQQLDAFLAELAAQAGKQVSVQAAQALAADARFVQAALR